MKVKGWLAVMGRYSVFMLSPCNHVTSTMTLLLAVFQFQEMARSTSVLGARRGARSPGLVFRMRLLMVHYLSSRARALAVVTGCMRNVLCAE